MNISPRRPNETELGYARRIQDTLDQERAENEGLKPLVERCDADLDMLNQATGWPGDGSGEDDLADYNQNESQDYQDE